MRTPEPGVAMRTRLVWFVVMPVLFLSGCSDPVLVGLTGAPELPLALIDPCRTEFHHWTRLEVVESQPGGPVLWAITSATGRPIDMRSVQYGRTPEGAKVIEPPRPLSKSMVIQWRYTAPDSEAVLQTFDLSHISPSMALETDNSVSRLKDWETCRD